MKLTNRIVHNIELRASPQFGHGGSISVGLLKIVKDYRFAGSFFMPLPFNGLKFGCEYAPVDFSNIFYRLDALPVDRSAASEH